MSHLCVVCGADLDLIGLKATAIYCGRRHRDGAKRARRAGRSLDTYLRNVKAIEDRIEGERRYQAYQRILQERKDKELMEALERIIKMG